MTAADASGGRRGVPIRISRVAKIFVDPRDNEAYIADGYLNKRVAVLDADTGKMKRYWGAYGNKPDDRNLGPYNPDAPPAQQFRNPVHCADVSNDNLVYVCDRVNTRLQVFTKEGKFVKENWYARRSLADGSVWDVAFSKDPKQQYIFMADGRNQRVRVIRRDTLEELTAFGDGGRYPGQFFGVHSIAIDSKGNLYTTETYEGKRLQKFIYRGEGNVPRSQGVDMAARSAVRTLVTVANGPLDRLHAGLDDVQLAIAAVHDEVQATYFPPPPEEPTTIDVRDDRFGAGAEAGSE